MSVTVARPDSGASNWAGGTGPPAVAMDGGDGTPRAVWSFGFGSNMNVEFVRRRKGLEVLASAPAVVPGWRLSFALRGLPRVEPAWATAVRGAERDELHGVALMLSREAAARLDRQESGYTRAPVTIRAYDGRVLAGYLYTSAVPLCEREVACSRRYRELLVSGAAAAGLDAAYVRSLATLPVYEPSARTRARRAALPPPEALPPCAAAELAASVGVGACALTAVLGYVLRVPLHALASSSHEGRDITACRARYFRGLPAGGADDDSAALPLARPLARMGAHEREYVCHWLDYYLAAGAQAIAYLRELLGQDGADVRALLQLEGGAHGVAPK